MFFKLNSSCASDLINVNVSLHDHDASHEKLERRARLPCLFAFQRRRRRSSKRRKSNDDQTYRPKWHSSTIPITTANAFVHISITPLFFPGQRELFIITLTFLYVRSRFSFLPLTQTIHSLRARARTHREKERSATLMSSSSLASPRCPVNTKSHFLCAGAAERATKRDFFSVFNK